ncbi:MAG: putative apolipoprotein A-I-binding protein [Streblomastix strix]|uniref:NAD(P)H-hydrate epimerase n=1 Tax=Streblomastix strix TaxID=222440 RepID=A0A5J4U2S1_9EUKA|nr:MAG: putative apolipoprotein A-I-binding protein [Streblomastix strix]
MKFLTQNEAIAVDETLFTECGYSVDQLMELAGQSIAHVTYHEYKTVPNILVVCGPGNNGGDGLVAARHLHFLGKNVTVFLPKAGKSQLLQNLIKQMQVLQIPILNNEIELNQVINQQDVILDAIFGHSFKHPVNEQFKKILEIINTSGKDTVSVDIPSGWDVEKGDITGEGLKPKILISLSAPKLCATHFKGIHYLGGRFLPSSIIKKFNLDTPKYPDNSLFIRLYI